jgi:hypothetical protein
MIADADLDTIEAVLDEGWQLSREQSRSLLADVRALRAAANGLSEVLLHWRDRSAGYMNAPEFPPGSPFRQSVYGTPAAFERVAGLARDLAVGRLDAGELDRLAHFKEDGPCTAYDYADRATPEPANTVPDRSE